MRVELLLEGLNGGKEEAP